MPLAGPGPSSLSGCDARARPSAPPLSGGERGPAVRPEPGEVHAVAVPLAARVARVGLALSARLGRRGVTEVGAPHGRLGAQAPVAGPAGKLKPPAVVASGTRGGYSLGAAGLAADGAEDESAGLAALAFLAAGSFFEPSSLDPPSLDPPDSALSGSPDFLT